VRTCCGYVGVCSQQIKVVALLLALLTCCGRFTMLTQSQLDRPNFVVDELTGDIHLTSRRLDRESICPRQFVTLSVSPSVAGWTVSPSVRGRTTASSSSTSPFNRSSTSRSSRFRQFSFLVAYGPFTHALRVAALRVAAREIVTRQFIQRWRSNIRCAEIYCAALNATLEIH